MTFSKVWPIGPIGGKITSVSVNYLFDKFRLVRKLKGLVLLVIYFLYNTAFSFDSVSIQYNNDSSDLVWVSVCRRRKSRSFAPLYMYYIDNSNYCNHVNQYCQNTLSERPPLPLLTDGFPATILHMKYRNSCFYNYNLWTFVCRI